MRGVQEASRSEHQAKIPGGGLRRVGNGASGVGGVEWDASAREG